LSDRRECRWGSWTVADQADVVSLALTGLLPSVRSRRDPLSGIERSGLRVGLAGSLFDERAGLDESHRLRAGSLDHRIDLPTSTRSNEIEDLADAFNEMASALHASHGELARRAAFDGLTGLANRAWFHERQERHFSTIERRSESVSVLFIDVDDFKFVNDSIGHAAGDALLVAVAGRLSAVRPPRRLRRPARGPRVRDHHSRPTGEATAADTVAQRVLEAFTEPILLGGRLIPVAVSIGLSVMRRDTRDSASLLSEADFAMYTAKRAGKARREVFDATADSITAPVTSSKFPLAATTSSQ
jgi:GGDEF domain-containing protein